MTSIFKTTLFTGLTVLMLGTSIDVAKSCTCPEPSEQLATEYYEDMDHVFEAEIANTTKDNFRHSPKITMKITREYKGKFEDREVTFDYNPNQNLCGFEFKPQELVTLGAYAVEGKSPRIAFSCAQMGVRKYLIMQGGYPR
jgi:hypothetical protein